MKNDIYDNMLSAYDLSTEQQKRNAIFEVKPAGDTCRALQWWLL